MHLREEYISVCVLSNERFVVVPLKESKGSNIWKQPSRIKIIFRKKLRVA
jgi:hypothetical protein